jgi:hypothetical protein
MSNHTLCGHTWADKAVFYTTSLLGIADARAWRDVSADTAGVIVVRPINELTPPKMGLVDGGCTS